MHSGYAAKQNPQGERLEYSHHVSFLGYVGGRVPAKSYKRTPTAASEESAVTNTGMAYNCIRYARRCFASNSDGEDLVIIGSTDSEPCNHTRPF